MFISSVELLDVLIAPYVVEAITKGVTEVAKYDAGRCMYCIFHEGSDSLIDDWFVIAITVGGCIFLRFIS